MEFHTQLIKEIRDKINTLPNLNESNIKNHVVIDIFLERMGYARSMCNFEENCRNDFADFFIKISKNKNLIVETKNGYNDLSEKDIYQLVKYLTSRNEEWGLLSNGFRYILINNNIKSLDTSKNNLSDKIVLDISINKKTDVKYLKYFSKKSIFEDKTTYYFVHIAQFKSYASSISKSSWSVYKSTLFNFFDYYANKNGYKYYSNDINEPLTKIDIEDYFEFIENKMMNQKGNRKLNSKETIKDNYSYFSSFFKVLKKFSYISDHNFKYSRKEILAKYDDTPKIKKEHHLTNDRFEKALIYIHYHKNSDRNTVIFLLCAYYGVERSLVNNLKWDQIDMQHKTIKFDKRTIEMNDLMIMSLNNIKNINGRKKNEYVLLKCCKNGYERANVGVINSVFNDLQHIDESDTAWKCFSPRYVRGCLIKEMFSNGYFVEQILYEVDLSLSQLCEYVPNDDIFNLGKKRADSKTIPKPSHPFENVVNKFYQQITS